MILHSRLALFGVILSLSVFDASAAVVLSQGTLSGLSGNNNDEIDRWRTPSVAKSLDPDGDNIYGTAGYVLFGTDTVPNENNGAVLTTDPLTYSRTLSQIPSYLTLANAGQNQIATSYGYKELDDPTQTPGSTVDVVSGAALLSSPLGVEQSMLTLTIGPNFPTEGLRVGFFTNNTDNFFGSLRLTQTIGGSASVSISLAPLPSGQDLALRFFDIMSAVEGDVFTLYLQKAESQTGGGNTNTNVLYGGITMDVIPEPGSATLLASAALGLAFRRRRNR